MSDNFYKDSVTKTLTVAVPLGGKVVLNYPSANRKAHDYSDILHTVTVNSSLVYTVESSKVSITFEANTFTVTNNTGFVWDIGTVLAISLDMRRINGILEETQENYVPPPAPTPIDPGGVIYASSYGIPSGVNDTTLVQNAFNAAVAGSRKLVLDGPPGTVYALQGTIQDSTGAMQTPRISDVNTTTGVVTFNAAHNLQTGNVLGTTGTNIGNGGALAQITAYTEYFFNRLSSTTGYFYNTKANAVTGTATGRIIPNIGVQTTGVFNTITNSGNINNGATSFTANDASKLVIGDFLNFTGNGSSSFPKITNIVGNVITFSPAWGGSTITAGTTIWTSSMDVVSALTLEVGSTVSMNSYNSVNSVFIITSINGLTLHFNNPPNTNLTASSQTVTLGAWCDPKYQAIKFELSASPGVIVIKGGSFTGTMFQWFYCSNIYIHDMELRGLTTGYTPDPNIVNGDDGIRVLGSAMCRVERCILKDFGDSALRFHTSSYWVGAKSTTYPNAGVYSNNIIVQDCTFINCFQLSTTNSNSDYQGGSTGIWYVNNYFDGIGGSVKFANRAPGAMDVFLLDNRINKCGRHGFELDSIDNYIVRGNVFRNVLKYGVVLIANNQQPIGFEFHDAKIIDNIFYCAGASTGGGIYFASDLYPDNTLWDYRGLEICRNKFYDCPNGSYPVQVANGSLVDFRLQDNTVDNCANPQAFRLTPRISVTTGFRNMWQLTGNIVRNCSGTKCSMFYIFPGNGVTDSGKYIRGIMIANNMFDINDVTLGSNASNDGRFLWGDFLQDVIIHGNYVNGFGGSCVYIQTEGKDITVRNNEFIILNTASGSVLAFNGVNGVYISRNRLVNSYAGTGPVNFDRKCQNVKYANDNDLSQSASKSVSLGNVPNKSGNTGQLREDYVSSAPNSGTWDAGDRYWFTGPAANTSMGGICTVGGSYSTISATGDSTNGSAVITSVSSMSNISIGMYLTHAGFSGTRKVIAMTSDTVTLNANATSDQTAAALAVANPTFKAMAAIAA